MSSQPTLTVVPAHVPAHVPAATAPLGPAALPVDPATRTGCAWYAVPAPSTSAGTSHAA